MLKVVDERKVAKTTVDFADLPIGAVYEDKEGIICIKVNHECSDSSSYGQCLACINDDWELEEEHHSSKVTPVSAKLTIMGYK